MVSLQHQEGLNFFSSIRIISPGKILQHGQFVTKSQLNRVCRMHEIIYKWLQTGSKVDLAFKNFQLHVLQGSCSSDILDCFTYTLAQHSHALKNNTHKLTSDSNVQYEMCMNTFKGHKSHRKRSGNSLCDSNAF